MIELWRSTTTQTTNKKLNSKSTSSREKHTLLSKKLEFNIIVICKINSFFQQWCNKLIKSDSKDIYNLHEMFAKYSNGSVKGSYDVCMKTLLSSALWLAEYLSVRRRCNAPQLYCDAVSRRDETKTIKPIINEALLASSGDIITDYNELFCLFTCRVESRHINITMSVFVIGETTNNKHYSTLLKTHVWIANSLNEHILTSHTTIQKKSPPSFIAYTFGRCYANLPTET